MAAVVRERNDHRQYDDLAGEWWEPDGQLAPLHWLAAARGALGLYRGPGVGWAEPDDPAPQHP